MASKKIFLILGISRESRNWNTPIKTLQDTLPDFDVIALDNPGTGVHHQMNVPLNIEKHVTFLKTDYEKLKGDENYFLGWSMGGMIVAKWDKMYPTDMDGLILMTSSFGALQFPLYRLKPLIVPNILITIFSNGVKREKGLFKDTCNNTANEEVLIKEWMEIQNERPITGMNIIRQVFASFFFLSGAKKMQHPTLIIGAPNDNLVSSICSTKLSKYWKEAKYIEHSTAGHDVFNDEPTWVSNEIKTWLNK